jgi:hypothetical protein
MEGFGEAKPLKISSFLVICGGFDATYHQKECIFGGHSPSKPPAGQPIA